MDLFQPVNTFIVDVVLLQEVVFKLDIDFSSFEVDDAVLEEFRVHILKIKCFLFNVVSYAEYSVNFRLSFGDLLVE